MKVSQKLDARKMRAQGLSVKKIALSLGVAKSSVSVWVRDIQLTEEQRDTLSTRTGWTQGLYVDLGKANSERYRGVRRQHQQAGHAKFLQEESFRRLCMLYWAEGSKRKDAIVFTNSDPDMMRVFVTLLRECFNLESKDITLCVNAHLNNGLSQGGVESYWLGVVGLPATQLRAGTYNTYSKASKQQRRNLIYGTARLTICDVRLAQMISGGIAECCGVEYKYLM